MCGIIAYKGTKYNASDILFKGLHLLEYRGYDSAGIAVIKNNQIKIFKVRVYIFLIIYCIHNT